MTRFWRPVSTSSTVAFVVDRRVLRGDANRATDCVGLLDDVVPGDACCPAVRPGERGQDAYRGGLAGAVWAEHAEDRAGGDPEIEPAQGHGAAKALSSASASITRAIVTGRPLLAMFALPCDRLRPLCSRNAPWPPAK